MSSFESSSSRSFTSLNIAQFCTTLNDNLFKILLAFFLINLQGQQHSFTILAFAGGIFVIPFILFAATAGTLADRYSKRTIIFVTRGLEIVITLLGVLSLFLKSPIGGYTALFLLAAQGALFSPCKYGVIPELVPHERISYYNGIMTATTYLAVIIGTFLASFLTQATGEHFVWAGMATVGFALIGAVASLWIAPTLPQARKKKISYSVFGEIWRTLKRAKERRYLLPAILFSAYFLFMAGYTQLNMIPYTLESLKLPQVIGGYVFLMTALGIGLGSYVAGRIAGGEGEIGMTPLAALGSGLSMLSLYWFQTSVYGASISLFFLGFFGGMYIVPLDVFIQIASPNRDRGQNVSAANFLSFTSIILASALLIFFGNLLKIQAATGFAVIGCSACLLGVVLGILFADQLFRLVMAAVASLFWDLKVVGKRRLSAQPPLVIVGQRRSWLDILIIMATLPRLVRYIVPVDHKTKRHPLYYRLFRVIPLHSLHYSPIAEKTLVLIEKELKQGHSVCIMHPKDSDDPQIKEWREKVEMWLHDVEVHAIPLYITHEGSADRGGRFSQFFSLFGKKVKVGFGLPIIH